MKPNLERPVTPNLDQLTSVSSSNFKVKGNPAAYGEEPATELKPSAPVVVIPPGANYIVDTTYSAGDNLPIDLPGTTPPENGEPSADPPILSSLDPAELPVWAQDTEVFYYGSNFTIDSKIVWNEGEEATKFYSPQELSTIVKPSTVQAPLPFALQTYVVDSGRESSKLAFTFIT